MFAHRRWTKERCLELIESGARLTANDYRMLKRFGFEPNRYNHYKWNPDQLATLVESIADLSKKLDRSPAAISARIILLDKEGGFDGLV